MGSRESNKAATREALVDAATRLFQERGVDGTTMDDIARVAGTSRTSVFNYFPYKELLLCEIGARMTAQIATSADATPSRDPRQRLYAMVDMLATLTARQPAVMAAVARELTHPNPERRARAAATMGYGPVVEGTFDQLEAGGLLRDARRRATHARALTDIVIVALIHAGGDFPLSRLRNELRRRVDTALDGILKPA